MKSWLLYKPQDFFPSLRDEAEVDTLLNNDVYKFFMLDFILAHPEYVGTPVRWKMTIRNRDIATAKVFSQEKLERQLKMTREKIQGVSESDLSYLRGMTNTQWKRLFREETLKFLSEFRLPDFQITQVWNNYQMTFEGAWENSMMWEIFALKIVNSLYLSEYIKKEEISDAEFTHIINQVLTRLFDDIKILKSSPQATFSEFGTRRSMSTNFQRMINEILWENLPGQYVGTSNVQIAKEMGSANPKGTNAHELRMIPTALIDDPEEIIKEMYEIDRKWGKHFPELALLLPDTYGTSFYLKHAPEDIIENHTGMRFDSKDPMQAIPEYIDWLIKNGQDPMKKIGIPSDGLNAQKVVEITNKFHDKLGRLTFWIGTNLTNNTKETWPRETEPYGPFGSFSVVVKPMEVQRPDGTWTSTVKLSDNPNKAMGSQERVTLFKNIFWDAGMQSHSVSV